MQQHQHQHHTNDCIWICMKAVWLDIVWYAFYWFPSKRVCFRLLAIRLRAQNAKRKMSCDNIRSILFNFFFLTCVYAFTCIFFCIRNLFFTAHVFKEYTSFGFVVDFPFIFFVSVFLHFFWSFSVRFIVSTLVKLCVFLPLLLSQSVDRLVQPSYVCLSFQYFSFKDALPSNDTTKFCPNKIK